MGLPRHYYSVGFCITLALMILLVPFSWLVAMMVAAFFHEVCHFLAIYLLTARKASVGLFSYSAKMSMPEMPAWQEAVCALAGPIGGLLLVLFAPVFPKLALCALVQSLYNLIPIYPMDGGRLLKCILVSLLMPPDVERVMQAVSHMLRIALLLCGLIFSIFLHLGMIPILTAILICIRTK